MKTRILITLILSAVLMQGCIVKSLHPFFTTGDIVFHASLLSDWVDQEGNKWTVERIKDKPNAYSMTLRKDDKEASFVAHLFELDGELYFDFFPLSSNCGGPDIFELHLLPSHSVAKLVRISDDEIHIKWFNEKWLSSLFKQNRIKIAHEVVIDDNPDNEEDNTYLLTATTEELQKFLIKYGNEDAAFDSNDTMWLQLKRAGS